MGYRNHRARRDDNHGDIVEALENAGIEAAP